MAVVSIIGKEKLSGEVFISGSKNSVLPIMAATVLCQGVTILENCPDISDVRNMIKILEYKEVFILCIVYNPKSSEFCMIFKGNPNDSSLERFINDFLEMESY